MAQQAGSPPGAQRASSGASGPGARCTLCVFTSLVLLVLAPLGWLWTIDDPLLRSTGLAAWLLLGAALLLALSAARVDRRPWVRAVLVLELGALAGFAWLFFGFARLPKTPEITVAPDFTLPDHLGRPVHLAEELARGPVLLVFFRGHW